MHRGSCRCCSPLGAYRLSHTEIYRVQYGRGAAKLHLPRWLGRSLHLDRSQPADTVLRRARVYVRGSNVVRSRIRDLLVRRDLHSRAGISSTDTLCAERRSAKQLTSAMGHPLPSRMGRRRSRFTPDSCRLVAPPNFGCSGPQAGFASCSATASLWSAGMESRGSVAL
jgi:hypothetical protein